jgi:TRAP-type uncharacterized transport system fused permease subunit
LRIAVALVLEATRRAIGLFMALIAVAFLLFPISAPTCPDILAHKGYSVERIVTTLYLTTEGIWGLPVGVAATFVFVFILFGCFLEKTGGGDFFIDLAYSITGRMTGGPAKTRSWPADSWVRCRVRPWPTWSPPGLSPFP